MSCRPNSPIEEIRILTTNDELCKLYTDLNRKTSNLAGPETLEIDAFKPYQTAIFDEIANVISLAPDAFIAVAYGESDIVLGVRTGYICNAYNGVTAKIGWVIRRQSEKFKGAGIGLDLIYASNNFLRDRGVKSVFTIAGTDSGEDMIEKAGGLLLQPREGQQNINLPEYVWHLTEKSRECLAAK